MTGELPQFPTGVPRDTNRGMRQRSLLGLDRQPFALDQPSGRIDSDGALTLRRQGFDLAMVSACLIALRNCRRLVDTGSTAVDG